MKSQSEKMMMTITTKDGQQIEQEFLGDPKILEDAFGILEYIRNRKAIDANIEIIHFYAIPKQESA